MLTDDGAAMLAAVAVKEEDGTAAEEGTDAEFEYEAEGLEGAFEASEALEWVEEEAGAGEAAEDAASRFAAVDDAAALLAGTTDGEGEEESSVLRSTEVLALVDAELQPAADTAAAATRGEGHTRRRRRVTTRKITLDLTLNGGGEDLAASLPSVLDAVAAWVNTVASSPAAATATASELKAQLAEQLDGARAAAAAARGAAASAECACLFMTIPPAAG